MQLVWSPLNLQLQRTMLLRTGCLFIASHGFPCCFGRLDDDSMTTFMETLNVIERMLHDMHALRIMLRSLPADARAR
jgi:hypothetical protein